MRVVSVDPAPSKNSTLYSAEDGFQPVPAGDVRSRLKSFAPPVLLCWDAPLTGPRSPEEAGGQDGDFTTRRFEKFLMRGTKKKGFGTPKGITVAPYCGCPHWTISRAALGLPRVGPFDAD